MHATLRPWPNIVLIAICALVAVLLSCIDGTVPYIALVIGVPFGLLVGGLQLRAMRSSVAVFQQANNAMDVRRALVSTLPGKRAIQIQWAGAAILVGAGIISKDLLRTPIVGYFAFMCVRDICALPGVITLNR